MVDLVTKPTAKQVRALALRRTGLTWRRVARFSGTSRRGVKRWAKVALLAEQAKEPVLV